MRFLNRSAFFKISIIYLSVFLSALPVFSAPAEVVPLGNELFLTLPEAIKIALANNPNVDSMLRSLERSEYLYRAASKEWLPTFSVDYTFTGLPRVIEVEMEGVDDSGNDKFPITDNTSLVFGAHVKMPLYTGGAITYRKDMAKFGIDAARIRLMETKADLIQEVTINYLNILRLRNYSKVVTENLKRFMEHEENTSKNFDVGLVAKNSLLEIRAKRANVQQELIEVEKDLKVAKAALNVSMGVDIDSEFILEDISERREMPYSIEECFGLAKENNPTLVVFTYLKKIAEKSVELEKTDTRPQVFGDISYYRHGKTPALKGDDYFTNDIVTGVVKAEWKFFDWFKAADLTNAKKEEVAELVDKLRSVEDRIALDIREAYLALKAAKNKFKVAERAIEYASENYRIAQLRYDEMVAKSTEVNDALVLLRQSEFNYYTAFFEYSVSVARLERITGINLLDYGQ
ncbi:MAG: TolC family protein [Candidatus Omnitrophica bacterium]|nr:TolC family protein [Candidatus Omnitrophota bacterium]